MTKYIQIILFFWLLATSPVQSKTMEQELVRKAGESWLASARIISGMPGGKNHLGESAIPIKNNAGKETIAYVYQLEPTGFVVLSNDNRINPVLAYSNAACFYAQDVPQNTLLQMIRADLGLRHRALDENRFSPVLLAANQIKWAALLDGNANQFQIQSTARIVGPFITSIWGQGTVNGENVFNLFTPNKWSTGCVATAMSQILHYYRWPARGFGSHLYNEDDAGVISVNFDSTVYDWGNMLDVYDGIVSTQAQKEAVARLGFHCGVSVEMDYESTGSTASTRDVPDALANYFAHSGEYVRNQSADFYPLLKNEMLHQRPVQLAISATNGAGHSVVVDGYADHNNFYHLNMGWLGKNNSWYDLEGSFNAGGYTIIDGGVVKWLPVPVFADSLTFSPDSVTLSWHTSFRSNPENFELHFSERLNGPWRRLSNTITDSFYQANVNDLLHASPITGLAYFRVRSFADSTWSGWSPVKAIKLRPDCNLTFRVNLSRRPLNKGDIVVVRGNLPPLSGYQNSTAFSGPDSNGVYEATIAFDYAKIDQLLKYRFAFVSGTSVTMESKNREYRLTSDEHQLLPIVYFDDDATDVASAKNGAQMPSSRFIANYPNPFNAATTVHYYLPQAGLVELGLYDITGRFIGWIHRNDWQSAGFHKLQLDFGSLFSPAGSLSPASGTYLIVLKTKFNKQTAKILYLK